ncbi:MAG TPA: DUF262 domain-containing HNH endonuclease family protein [Hyphomicrobium sp.]|nr:DUF262 domain-containing HNH endonuclease family protein [Hyphomicrobium sp.]HRO48992.1 DUF262 domain-containing HNH endonuclease family protein [Hyphomicrobium sp.]
MHDVLSVSVVPLKDLFSDAYHFRLPYFQRAYAWQTPEVGRLLADIVGAMRNHETQRGYFLGKLVVAKKADGAEAALVDGHQRVMSLTLLFAVLRDLESDPKLQDRLHGFIRGDDMRLSPQDVMAEFCERYVQAPGATAINPAVDFETLSESERNIIENRNALRAELSGDDYTPELRRALIGYLAERCCVIVSSLEDEDEAWSLLRTEEETRVDFSKSDRAKFSLLAIVPPNERAACQKIWETCEAALGASDMHALLGHIRLLKRRRLSGKPVEIDIADTFKFNAPGAGHAFLDHELRPAAERLAALRNTSAPAPIPQLAERCRWIDPQLWVPAALLWFERTRHPEETLLFFKRLERLVWMMRIAGFDPTKQHTRILHLMGEIDRGVPLSRMSELDMTTRLKDAAIFNLRSTSFDAKHYAGRVLRRISIALGQDPGPVERNSVTIEHILPRGYAPKSGWRAHFASREAVQRYTHRLGNLTFLAPGDNQQADTLDWAQKKPILARSQFLLSKHVAEERDWTPDRILARTETLIGVLFKEWDIKR